MGFGTISRQEIISQLTEIYGYECYLYDCKEPFTDDNPPTIDHYMPQEWCKRQGWTIDETNALSNLRLAHRKCNALKSNILPNPDGTIDMPVRVERAQKVQRTEVCDTCYSGRLLLHGEVCDLCGSGPQPATAPKYLQVAIKECDHDATYCAYCYIGLIRRKSALEHLLIGP